MGFGIWNELNESVNALERLGWLALNDTFLMLCGASSSSVSLIAFAFSMRAFMLAGMVLEGNISATCKVRLAGYGSQEKPSYLFVAYLQYITTVIRSSVSGSGKIFVVCIVIVIVHDGSLAFKAPGLERLWA